MAPKGPSGRGPHRLGGPYTPHMGCVLTRLSVLHCVRNGKPRLILPGLLMAVYIAFGEYRCRTERRCPAPIGPFNTAWAVLGIGSHEIGRAQATNNRIRASPPGGPVTHYYACCIPAEALSSVLRDCCPFLRPIGHIGQLPRSHIDAHGSNLGGQRNMGIGRWGRPRYPGRRRSSRSLMALRAVSISALSQVVPLLCRCWQPAKVGHFRKGEIRGKWTCSGTSVAGGCSVCVGLRSELSPPFS